MFRRPGRLIVTTHVIPMAIYAIPVWGLSLIHILLCVSTPVLGTRLLYRHHVYHLAAIGLDPDAVILPRAQRQPAKTTQRHSEFTVVLIWSTTATDDGLLELKQGRLST